MQPDKLKLGVSIAILLAGLIMLIVGITKVNDCNTIQPLLAEANALVAASKKERPQFRDFTITLLQGSNHIGFAPVFGDHTFLQENGNPAIHIQYSYQTKNVNASTPFPLKLQIIHLDASHNLELAGSFTEWKTIDMVCETPSGGGDSCTQAEMTLACTSTYVDPNTYTATTSDSCKKRQTCGTCKFLVRRLAGCWALNPPDTKKGDGPADWSFANGTECPAEVADRWSDGKKADVNNLPAYFNVSLFNSHDPFVSISNLLTSNGFTSGVFPNQQDSCEHKGAGTATIVFGVLFLLVGGLSTFFYGKKQRDADYNAVPDSWRHVN